MHVEDDFNSLPHAEVDNSFPVLLCGVHYFNSLPHAEVDMNIPDGIEEELPFQLTTSRRGRQIE